MSVFRGSTSHQPPRQVNGVVQRNGSYTKYEDNSFSLDAAHAGCRIGAAKANDGLRAGQINGQNGAVVGRIHDVRSCRVVGRLSRMPLPEFNEFGDLPEGNYRASLEEVIGRFGAGTPQRQAVTSRLRRIHKLAVATGYLDRIVVFGSYVSDVSEPNDVDVILVMRNDFRSEDCPVESAVLFDHAHANDELGASIFWIRPDMLLGEPLEQFLAFWQTKRGGKCRGIVEIFA
jgi:hypothetical protein